MNSFFSESDRLIRQPVTDVHHRKKSKMKLSSYRNLLNVINMEDLSALQAISTLEENFHSLGDNIFNGLISRFSNSNISSLKKILPLKVEFNWNEVKYHDQKEPNDHILIFKELGISKSTLCLPLEIDSYKIDGNFLDCRFEKFLRRKGIYSCDISTKFMIMKNLFVGKIYIASHLSSCIHKIHLSQLINGHYKEKISKAKHSSRNSKCRICYTIQASIILSGTMNQIDDPCQLCTDCALMLFSEDFIKLNGKPMI